MLGAAFLASQWRTSTAEDPRCPVRACMHSQGMEAFSPPQAGQPGGPVMVTSKAKRRLMEVTAVRSALRVAGPVDARPVSTREDMGALLVQEAAAAFASCRCHTSERWIVPCG
eukprot:6476747-Amphidinium_carterae.1